MSVRYAFAGLLALIVSAAAVAVAQPFPTAKITGRTEYEPHELVRLKAEGIPEKAAILWRINPAVNTQRATTPRGILEFAAPPGSYQVEMIVITQTPDGLGVDEASVVVKIKSCHPEPAPPTPPGPTPPGPNPNPPKPGGGTLNPSMALGRIQFGNAGCTATVIGPRRPDGRWDVLTASHCMGGVGLVGKMTMPSDNKVYSVRVVAHDKEPDIAWLVTEESIDDICYANLSKTNPPAGTQVWHQGYGIDQPRNKETGSVADGPNSQGMLRFILSVSSGDSGGGIFRADTNEVVASVCCTAGKGIKTSMWGGCCETAWRMRPKTTTDEHVWTPRDIPTRADPDGTAANRDEWVPVEIPLRADPNGGGLYAVPLRSAALTWR